METEDDKIKRICVSKSINRCLSTTQCWDKEDIVNIYKCESNKVIQTTLKQVPDRCIISVAPLTSKKKRPMPTHVELTRADGVKQDSLISIEQTKVVSKRRLFYNRVPIKVVDLSEEKIAEVNTAIEKQFGLIDCLFNEDVAFELVEQIKVLEQNKKIKQSKGLIDILDSKIQELINYCKKYHRNINTVVRDYEKNQRYAC